MMGKCLGTHFERQTNLVSKEFVRVSNAVIKVVDIFNELTFCLGHSVYKFNHYSELLDLLSNYHPC